MVWYVLAMVNAYFWVAQLASNMLQVSMYGINGMVNGIGDR
jgi:hypothetical protein